MHRLLVTVIAAALVTSCDSTEPEPEPGSIQGKVEYCWNASCDPWTWGGEATLSGGGAPQMIPFNSGSFAFNGVPVGRYTLIVDSDTTLRWGSLRCLPKFSPESIEVLEAQTTHVVVKAQLSCG